MDEEDNTVKPALEGWEEPTIEEVSDEEEG